MIGIAAFPRSGTPVKRCIKSLDHSLSAARVFHGDRRNILVHTGHAGTFLSQAGSSLLKAFSHTQGGARGALITLVGGAVNIHGRASYQVSGGTVTMGQVPHCWVYVLGQISPIGTLSSVRFAQSPERVISNNSELRWPLLHYQFVNGIYKAPEDGSPVVLWDGEINISPLSRA